MDDATQKLVDEARRDGRVERIRHSYAAHAGGDFAQNAADFDAMLAALVQRPPVSPEVREAAKNDLCTAMLGTTDGGLIDLASEIPAGEMYRLASEWLDGFLTRFSVPSQPVYDEEKIARWLHNWVRVTPGEPSEFIQNLAAALVAALRSGELTREET